MKVIINTFNQYETYCNTLAALLGLLFAMLLTGCDLHEPTSFHEERLTVQESNYAQVYETRHMSNNTFRHIAEDYERYGDGEMRVTVTYDPASHINSSFVAVENLGAVTASLRDMGIRDVQGSVLPIHERGAPSQTLIAYRSYMAHAPNCKQIPGLENRMPDTSQDYEFGCSTETLFSKQIYRPKDLLGNSALARADARRASNVVDGYRSGEPAEDLDAETVTE